MGTSEETELCSEKIEWKVYEQCDMTASSWAYFSFC